MVYAEDFLQSQRTQGKEGTERLGFLSMVLVFTVSCLRDQRKRIVYQNQKTLVQDRKALLRYYGFLRSASTLRLNKKRYAVH
jgi:hypothetical protein